MVVCTVIICTFGWMARKILSKPFAPFVRSIAPPVRAENNATALDEAELAEWDDDPPEVVSIEIVEPSK